MKQSMAMLTQGATLTKSFCTLGLAMVCAWSKPVLAADVQLLRPSQMVSAATRHVTACAPFGGAIALDTIEGADGTETTFSIPAGKVFVATSAEITVGYTGKIPANSGVNVKLFRAQLSSPYSYSFIAVRSASADANGFVNEQFEFPSGVPVKSGLSVCAAVENLSDIGTTVQPFAIVHGFFQADK